MKKVLLAALAATALALPSVSQAQGIEGDTVRCEVTDSGSLFCSEVTAVVGPGREFTIGSNTENFLAVNFSDSQLVINALQQAAIASLVLNFRDLTNPFTSASVTEISGFTGVTASDVSLNANGRLRVDIGPAAINRNDQIRIALSNASAVPEPTTWGMLLVGFGAVGYSLRRSPQRRIFATV